MAQSKVGNLEQEALKRRDRLKNLKRKREGKSENEENEKELELPKPVFRSYKPLNEELDDFVLDPSAPGDITNEVNAIFINIF